MAREMMEGPNGTQATHSATTGDLETTDTSGARSETESIDGTTDIRARLQLRANRAVEASTDYLRNHDLDEMRGDLEREIRAHPLKSIAIALGAGYVLGRIFR